MGAGDLTPLALSGLKLSPVFASNMPGNAFYMIGCEGTIWAEEPFGISFCYNFVMLGFIMPI